MDSRLTCWWDRGSEEDPGAPPHCSAGGVHEPHLHGRGLCGHPAHLRGVLHVRQGRRVALHASPRDAGHGGGAGHLHGPLPQPGDGAGGHRGFPAHETGGLRVVPGFPAGDGDRLADGRTALQPRAQEPPARHLLGVPVRCGVLMVVSARSTAERPRRPFTPGMLVRINLFSLAGGFCRASLAWEEGSASSRSWCST